jgi:lysophospholipase L1-like esterase
MNGSKTLYKIIILSVFYALLCLFLGELCARVLFKVQKKDINIYRMSPKAFLDGHYLPHPYSVWTLLPGFRYYENGNGRYSINSLGFRGDEVGLEKAPGVFRVVCAGDSTTFGIGAITNDYYAYPYLLGKLLKQRFPGRGIEVINAGVPAYTSAEILANLEFRILDLNPDLVILLQGINDAAVRTYPRNFGFLNDYSHYRKPLCPVREGRVSRKLRKYSYLYAYLAAIFEAKNRTINYHTVWATPQEEIMNSRWNRLKKTSDKIDTSIPFRRNTTIAVKLLKSYGIKAVLMTVPCYPMEEHKEWQGYISEQNDIVRDIAMKEKITLIDLEGKISKTHDYFDWIGCRDGVHMSDSGEEAKANLICGEILKVGLIR